MLERLFRTIAENDYTATPPRAYGPFHLIFTIVGFALCVLLAILLRKASDRVSRWVVFGCGAFLAVTEVYKQLFYYFAMDTTVHYHWWIFPFQLCSVPMYLCLIAPFLKNGLVKNTMYDFMYMFNLLGGAIAFFEPSGLLHSHWTLTLHAFIWHMLLVFVGLHLAISGRAGNRMKNYWSATVAFVIFAAMAFIINLIFRDVSGGSINMFYVGPSNSPLIVFKTICETLGWYVNTPIYLVAVSLGAFVVFLPSYIIGKIKRKNAK